jgi:alpha-amylase/alpha-mannosidase (GH57 family)
MLNNNQKKLAILWHIHQPIFIPDEEVKRQIRESYWVIISAHDKEKIPFSLNITGALLNRFIKLDMALIKKMQEMQKNGLLEIMASGYYHPMLPLLSESDAKMHIEMDKEIKLKIFQNKIKGFWPTDLGFAPWMCALLNEQGYKWTVLDSTSLELSNSLPLWIEVKKGNHKVLMPKIESIALKREMYDAYKMTIDSKQMTIFVRDHESSMNLSDFKTGALYNDRSLDVFIEQTFANCGEKQVVVLGEDGERINLQNALGYQKFLKKLKEANIKTLTPSTYLTYKTALKEKYFPASTFQYDLEPWTMTMDDQSYLAYLGRAEQAIQSLELLVLQKPLKEALRLLKLAKENILKAQDSGCIFWKFHSRTREPGWNHARKALKISQEGVNLYQQLWN